MVFFGEKKKVLFTGDVKGKLYTEAAQELLDI